jgi:PAS domain-containing protein
MSDRDGASSARESLLLAGQKQALALAAEGAPLHAVLELLVETAQTQSDGSFLASILLVDAEGRHLLHGAAPSLPQAYNDAIHGIAIGPRVGSCGTAAHFGHAIVVTDIEHDPLWADFHELALAHGLRACWSTPFLSRDGSVLGTFALYYRTPRGPSAYDRHMVSELTRTAARVVEAARLASWLEGLQQPHPLAPEGQELGFFSWDVAADRVVWYDERPYALFGIDASEGPINAHRFTSEFLHPEDQPPFAQAVAGLLAGAPSFHFEGRVRRKTDGALRWMAFHGQLQRAAGGDKGPRVVGVVSDVTARRQPDPTGA